MQEGGGNHHPPQNQLYRLYFCNNIPRDTRPYLHRVQDQPQSFNGPYRAPEMDLMIFAKISWFLRKFWVFLYFVFSSPSNHVGTLIWSLSNCTKAQGTLLDLHGRPAKRSEPFWEQELRAEILLPACDPQFQGSLIQTWRQILNPPIISWIGLYSQKYCTWSSPSEFFGRLPFWSKIIFLMNISPN